MFSKPYPAFGYVLIKNSVEAGEDITDETLKNNTYTVDENFKTIWLQLNGKSTHVNESGQTQVRVGGDSTLTKPLMQGKNHVTFDEAMDVFCVSAFANRDRNPPMPSLQHFALAAGQSTTLKKGTKLFLASGVVVGAGGEIAGPRQIEVISGDRTFASLSDCLGFIFL